VAQVESRRPYIVTILVLAALLGAETVALAAFFAGDNHTVRRSRSWENKCSEEILLFRKGS